MARKKQITRENLDELRLLIEELDLVPLSIYPPEVRPLVLDYFKSLENEDIPFNSEIERVSVNTYLRTHRRKRKFLPTQDDLILFTNI